MEYRMSQPPTSSAATGDPRAVWAQWARTFFGVARRRQAYSNLLYMLSILPLGMIYFLVLVVGFLVGVGSALSLIGVGVLWLTLALWLWLAACERDLTAWWLNVVIVPFPDVQAKGWWRRLQERLRRRVTWTSLLYLLVKFPAGVVAFSLFAVLLFLATFLVLVPFAYVAGLFTGGVASVPGAPPLLVGAPLLGVALGLATLHAANGAAWVWGWFSQVTLGMNRTEQGLREARTVVVAERARAERADQSRRELIVNVSHELRTPIASIRGHVESLLIATEAPAATGAIADAPTVTHTASDASDAGVVSHDTPPSVVGAPANGPATPTQSVDPAELRDYLGIVYRETERLGALVDDLLALARAEADELRLEMAPVAVGAIVEEVYQTLAPLARRERQITLIRNAPPGAPPALADRQRLLQVTLNLVRNAIIYTQDGGIVSLALAQTGADHLTLTVADTGYGMAPEELAHIFERFYRADASRSRATGGSGLGLAIVRDLTEAMGGSVSAESVVGQGSQFRVTLRVAL